MSDFSISGRFYAELNAVVELLYFLRSRRYRLNQSLLHKGCRTWAAASPEGFLLKKKISGCFVLPSFPASQGGKINACYVAAGTPEARGSKKKALWFLTSFISAWQKKKKKERERDSTQLCDQREFVWGIAPL